MPVNVFSTSKPDTNSSETVQLAYHRASSGVQNACKFYFSLLAIQAALFYVACSLVSSAFASLLDSASFPLSVGFVFALCFLTLNHGIKTLPMKLSAAVAVTI